MGPLCSGQWREELLAHLGEMVLVVVAIVKLGLIVRGCVPVYFPSFDALQTVVHGSVHSIDCLHDCLDLSGEYAPDRFN